MSRLEITWSLVFKKQEYERSSKFKVSIHFENNLIIMNMKINHENLKLSSSNYTVRSST